MKGEMFNYPKLPFWEKFSFRRHDPSAYFRRDSGTRLNLSFDDHSMSDKDSDFNFVITPTPDYDSRSTRSVKDYWTFKRKKKKTRKSEKYIPEYDRDDRNKRKRHEKDSHYLYNESHSSDSDSTISCPSTRYRELRRKDQKKQKLPVHSKRKERHNSSSPVREEESEYDSSTGRRHEKDFIHRKNRARKKPQAEKDKVCTGYHKRDPDVSDSSPERESVQTTKSLKQNKKKKRVKSSTLDSDTDGNWTLRNKNRNVSNGLMLKITMDDLKNVITENVLSAVKQEIDEDRNRQVHCATPELISTDTEARSQSSANSTDMLLPVISNRRRSSAFHPLPQRQAGMYKRYLPYSSSASSDSNVQSRNSSITTINSVMSGTSVGTADPGPGTRAAGYGVNYGPSDVRHMDKNENQLITQTSCLRGAGPQKSNQMGIMYENQEPHEIIRPYKPVTSEGMNRSSRFQDGMPNHDRVSPLIPIEKAESVFEGPCILQDSKGRRMSVTLAEAPKEPISYVSPEVSQRRSSVQQESNMCSLPLHIEPIASRRPTICMDSYPLQMSENLPPPSYITQRRQSLPVNLSGYPHPNLAALGLEAIMAAAEAKTQSSAKEKCLSTVPEETTETADDKSSADGPVKEKKEKESKVLPTTELLKNIKETAKEKRRKKCTKIVAILSSILVVFAGIGVLGLGVLNMMDADAEMYVAVTRTSPKDNSYQYYCYGLCFVGSSVVMVWFCGCVGAQKVNTCLLKMFIINLVLMLLLQGAMVTVVFVSQEKVPSIPLMAAIVGNVKDVVLSQMKTNLRETYIQDSLVAKAWDKLQVQAECCGCESQDDYKHSAWWNATTDPKTKMPDSCCVVAVKDLEDLEPTNRFLCQALTAGFWHDTGCHEVLSVWYKQNSVMVFGAVMALVVLEILCIILTVRLYRSLTQKQTAKEKATP